MSGSTPAPPGGAGAARARPSGFELKLEHGKAVVRLGEQLFLPGVRLSELLLEVPGVRFPFDVAAGAGQFRQHLCELLRIELWAEASHVSALTGKLALAGTGIEGLEVGLRAGFAEVAGRLSGGPAFTLKVGAEAEGEQGLRLWAYAPRIYGTGPVSEAALPSLLARAAAALGRADGAALTCEPLGATLRRLLPSRGWKLPRVTGARLSLAAFEPGRVRLAWDRSEAAPTPAADPELLAALEGARGFARAEALLIAGDAAGARDELLHAGPPATQHPFGAARLLALLSMEERFDGEALDLCASWRERRPDFAPALLAEARIRARHGEEGKASELLAQLAELSARRGEELSALAAADACLAFGPRAVPGAAARAVEVALAVRRDHLPALRALLALGERGGNREALLRACRRLAAYSTDDAEKSAAHGMLGRLLLQADPPAARLHLDHALRLSPGHPDTAEALARACEEAGEPLRAIKAWDRARELRLAAGDRAGAAQAAAAVGLLWEQKLLQPENALLRYRDAAELDPSPEAHERAALLAGTLGHWSEAQDGWGAVLGFGGDAPQARARAARARRELARIAEERFGDRPRACDHLEAAMLLEPGDTGSLVRLAALYDAQGRTAERLGAIDRLAALTPEPAARARLLAEAARLAPTPAEARRRWEAVLAAAPDEAGALRGLADAALAVGDRTAEREALSRLSRLLLPAEERAEALDLLSASCLAGGDGPAALEAASQARRTHPTGARLAREVALAREQRDPRLADILAEQAHHLAESDPASAARAWLARARLLEEGGDAEGALAALAEARLLSPDDGPVLEAQARLAEAGGDVSLALAALEVLAEQRPGDGALAARMARVALLAGDAALARSQAERAGALGSDEAGALLEEVRTRFADPAAAAERAAEAALAATPEERLRLLREALELDATSAAALRGLAAAGLAPLLGAERPALLLRLAEHPEVSGVEAGRALSERARALAAAGARAEALVAAREAVRRSPGDAEALDLLAELAGDGDPAGAAEALLARAALAREAGDPDAPLRLAGAGQAALAAGLLDGGRWALREAIRAGLDREDAVAAWQALARLAGSRGEGPAEREALVALVPLLPTGEKPAALLRLAALHEAAGDAALAREAVEQARRLAPRDPATVAASLAAAEKARDLPVVAERLDELAALDPATAGERLLERARLLAGPLARPEAADDELTRALALLPPSLALAGEQVRLRRAAPPPVGDRPWGEPLERFAARAGSPAEAAGAWRDAAGLALAQGDGGAALRCARAAWELTREEDATFAGPLWSRLLYREGGRDEALALHRHLFDTALLRLDERDQSRLCRRLAELAEDQGQPGPARAALARLAELRPLDAEAALAAFRLEPDRAQAVRALAERASAWRSVRSRVQAWSLAAAAAHRELRDPTLADALWRRARGAAGDYPALLAAVEEQRLQVARADHDPAAVGPPRELLEALRDAANARAAAGDPAAAADLHREAAALALGHGLTPEELQEREALRALQPGDAGLALDLCLAQARAGLHDDAVAGLRSWLAAHPDDPRTGEALSALGRAHLALEEPEQAAAAALRRLERGRRLGLADERRAALDDGCAAVEQSPVPLQHDFLEQLAAALLDEADPRGDAMGERAVEALSRAGENARAAGLVALASRAATGARRAAWLVRLSDTARARGDREAAAAALGEAVSAAPGDLALRLAHLAELEAAGRPAPLARALEEALRAPGADRAALLRRLAIAHREAGDAASAERAERELVGLGPETPGYREAGDALERRFEERGELRALADLRLRRAQGAAQPAERALRYAAASEALLRAGAADEARAAAQQASDEDPDAQRPWQALAAVEEREGRRAQAAAAHLAAALRGEGAAAASEALEAARLFERAGQEQEAARAYAAAAGAQPGNPEARRALARRAAAAGNLKEVARQLAELDILLLPREERREHELELARAYSAAGMTEADDSWRQLFDSDAGDPEVFEVLASAARRTGANSTWLELAARHDGALAGGDSSRRRDLRGARAGLLEEMGQLEAAEGAWQASLSIDPEYRPALRALRRLAELRGDTTAAADLAQREGSVAREPLEAATLFMEEGRLRRAANDLLRAAAAFERALARAEVVASPESFDIAAEARLGLAEVMPAGRLDEEVTEPVPSEGLVEGSSGEPEVRHDLPRTEAPTLALDEESLRTPAPTPGMEISVEGEGGAEGSAGAETPTASPTASPTETAMAPEPSPLLEMPPELAAGLAAEATSTPDATSRELPPEVALEIPPEAPTLLEIPASLAAEPAQPAPEATSGPTAAPAPSERAPGPAIEIPLEAPTLVEIPAPPPEPPQAAPTPLPAPAATPPPLPVRLPAAAPTPLPLPGATPPPLPARTPPPLRRATPPPAAAQPQDPGVGPPEEPIQVGEEQLLPVGPELEMASPAELASALESAIDRLEPEAAPGATLPDHPLPLPAPGATLSEPATGLLEPGGGALHSTLGLFAAPVEPPPEAAEPPAALDPSWEQDPDPAAEERLQAFAARATGTSRADALAALGRRREQRGAKAAAAEAYAAAAEADPPRAEPWLQALERLAGGEAERLPVQRLRVRLAQTPAGRVAAMVSLANALLHAGEGGRAEANEVLERALGLDPANGPAAEALARLSIATGQAERALALLGPLEGGAPGLPPRTVLALQLEAARVAGDPALALERARRAARSAPMDAELQEWWARAAAEAQEPREEAEAWAAALSAAPRAAPEEEGHRRIRLAAALRRQGRDDEALRELLRAAERAPEVGAVLDAAAEALRAAGRGRDALVYGERAARLEPSAQERRRRLGALAQAAEALPDRGLALWLWEGARAAAPGDAEVLRALVRLHAQAGGDPAQLAGLARELEAAGGADTLGPAAAAAGRALAASGDEEAGFRFLSVAQHADPSDHVLLREVVQLAERLGRHVEMVALGEQLAEAEAEAGQVAAAAARLRTLAQVAHDRLGDGVSTARLLERAAELRPAGPVPGAAAPPAEETGGGLAGALQRARQNPADGTALAALAAASARAAQAGGPDAARHAARAQVAEALAAFLDPRLPAPQPPPLARRLTPDLQGRAALPLAAGPTARLLALLAPWLEPLFPADLSRRGATPAHRLGPERAPALAARLAAAGRALGARPVVAFLSDTGGFEVLLENTQPPSLVIGARVPRELRESAVDFLLSRALCLAGVGWALVGKFAPRDVGILGELACRFAGAAPPALGLPAERAGAFLDALGRLVPVAVRERASTFAVDAAAELRNLPPRELQLALRRTAARQALVWSGDPLGALEGLVASRPGGDALAPSARAQALADADVADLASFALSDLYLELRLAVGGA